MDDLDETLLAKSERRIGKWVICFEMIASALEDGPWLIHGIRFGGKVLDKAQ